MRNPFFLLIIYCMLAGCKDSGLSRNVQFQVLEKNRTGLDFNNKLTPTEQFNVLKYMYFYNGGGVGAGDFNNDGLLDLFFAGNQVQNSLYLNKGNLHFENVTREANIPNDSGWSTGVSVVDINNDGLLDIYVCRVGNHETLHSHNQLLICQGIDKNGVPFFKDEAAAYGLNFSGFSTQAVFFDYDMDGDLDMYLLNHSIHQNGTFGRRAEKLVTYNPLSGDRLYRNNGNHTFTDVTRESDIHSSVIGYGLGVEAADVDLDGYPDLYVGNDFHENDYLYINQRNGKFVDKLNEQIMHTSQYTMGVDIGDLNNDGFPEIVSMDMLPSDPFILKKSLGEDEEDIFNLKIGYGYNYQYTRNNLQFNRRNGMFSEVGLYSGMAATDWSWSPLFADFDNDGLKDLFISNGIPKRLNDIDYVNFISNQEIQQKLRTDDLGGKSLELLEKFPEIKLPNRFFKNKGDLKFDDLEGSIEGNRSTFSNGAVCGDFDNDGDLDVVVNDINDDAILYRNTENDSTISSSVDVHLKGSSENINAIGSKIVLFVGKEIRIYEKFPVHGFLSSIEDDIHIGLGKAIPDSAFLIWPDNSFQPVSIGGKERKLSFVYRKGLPEYDYRILHDFHKNPGRLMKDISDETGIHYKHEENDFHEFDREPLLPHMLSTEGPALAVADINLDGLDDVFIGSSKWKQNAVLIQQPSGKFIRFEEKDLRMDSTWEDVDAVWTDLNKDGFPDLVVASGGNEFYGHDIHLKPRVYLNDGKVNLAKAENAFGDIYINASCVASYDFNGDGFPDLFIGGRSVPYDYGQVPASYLLLNDGHGNFRDVTTAYCKDLHRPGFVTSATWVDMNKDGRKDLILTFEWGGIVAWLNEGDSFKKQVISDKKGWWNFLLPVDIDGDGDLDFIAGNLGLNSRLTASEQEPVRLYYYDFDGNGKKEQILSYYLNGKEIPFANKDELQKQIPLLKKQFLYAEDFAKATMKQLFGEKNLTEADTLEANYFSNSLILNDGNMTFRTIPLPWEAQLSPLRTAIIVDANHDRLPDVLVAGNYYENNIQMGRYDADFGTVLINRGKDQLDAVSINGLSVRGQIRHIKKGIVKGKEAYFLARNNDSLMVIQYADQTRYKKE